MNRIVIRTAVIALAAACSLTALSAATAPNAPKTPNPKDGSPIPICYQCGHGDGN